MATHSSTLTWKIPWTEQTGGHSPWRHKVLDTTEWTERLTLSLSFQKRRESFQIYKAGNGVSERRINMCITLEELSRCLTEEGC